jgi:hypothetical protein
VITLLFSCAEPTTIGSELQESADVFATDTFSLKMTTIKDDSLEVFTPVINTAFSTFLCGNYDDEIMGEMSASIFTQFRVGTAPPDEFFTGTLDSVFLHLPYNFNNYYGNLDEVFTFEVYRMTEEMNIGETYYTTTTFNYDPSPVGSLTFTPSEDTAAIEYILTTEYIVSTGTSITDTSEISDHLRIPLDLSFGEEFTDLSIDVDSVMQTTLKLQEFFNGLHIRSVNSTDEGMVALDLNQFVSATSIGAGMTFFYSYPSVTGDTIFNRRHSIYTNSPSDTYVAKSNNVISNFSPEVEAAFDQVATGDEQLYLQALIGPNIEIEIPYADALKNTIINKADLTITVASPEDEDRNTPFQIIVATRTVDGTYQAIDDVLFAISRGNLTLFGGQVVENESLREYTFNLSAVFQDLADIKNEPLYLVIFPKAEQVSRMTIYGPDHSQYPAKLNVVYTKLPE